MNMAITIKNKKVVDFYQANPNISVDHVNLLLVDMMEKMVHDSINSTMVSQLLERLKSVELGVMTAQESISKLNPELLLNISMKLMEIKKEYMEDTRTILSSTVNDKISPLLKEYNSTVLDKTALLLQELPKSHDTFSSKIHDSMRELQKSILEETRKVSSGQSIQDCIQSIDQKFTATQFVLSTSYDKMDSSIKELKLLQDHQFSSVKELSSINQQSVTELLKKMENSSSKGKVSENILFHSLQTLYPSASIDFVGMSKETGDFIIERTGKPKVLIENKNWESTVPRDEVDKFIRDTSLQKCCGIFLSQNTGIANKENYEISVHDGNVLLYVHHVHNDAEKVKIALDIVDHFKERMDETSGDVEMDTIPKEVLDKINEECQMFLSQKSSLQKIVKDFQLKMCKQLDEMTLPSLDKYLASRYTNSSAQGIVCACGKPCKNKQAFASHKRGCKLLSSST